MAGNLAGLGNYGTATANIGTVVKPSLVGTFERALSGSTFELNSPTAQANYGGVTIQDVTVNLSELRSTVSTSQSAHLLQYH